MKKRILAVLLAATMLLSLVPMTVFATGTSYAITNGTPESAKETNHGYIAIDKATAAEGETVTVTVKPSEGYQLKTLTATPVAPTISTIADVLATVEGFPKDIIENSSPTAPSDAWTNGTGSAFTYKNLALVLKSSSYMYAQLTTGVTFDATNKCYTATVSTLGTLKFNMTDGVLTSFEYTGNTKHDYDGTYAPASTPSPSLKSITPAKQTDGTYQFTMPGYAVTVTAEFEEKAITIADILPDDFPRLDDVFPEDTWTNENGIKIIIVEDGLTELFLSKIDFTSNYCITSKISETTLSKDGNNYSYSNSGVTVTFVMSDNELSNIMVQGLTGDYVGFNGTYKAPHIHSFNYSANNDKITAACTEGCDKGYDTTPLTLTLTAPASLTYDGNPKAFTFADGEATAWTGAGLELPTIDYYQKKDYPIYMGIESAPIDAGGDYMAEIVVNSYSAQVCFAITKATPYIKYNPAPSDIIYGKKLADSTLAGGVVQISSTNSTEVAGLFTWTNPETIPGINDSEVTLYDVTFTPDDETNYNSVSCKVTITVNHTHAPVLVNGQAATETAAGFKDYCKCDCGDFFEDATGLIPIENLAAWRAQGGNGYIAPLVHSITPVNGQAATDTEAGFKAYYECKNCGKYYEDATGLVEITNIEAWKAEGGAGYIPKLEEEPTVTSLDLQIGDKEYYGITGNQTIEVKSLDDINHIKVLIQNGVDVEGMSDTWSMSTDYLDGEGRGVLEVQVFEEGDDYVIFNLVSHYADCPGANVGDFQVMMITAKLPAPDKFTVTFNMNDHGTEIAKQTVESGNKATKPADPTADGYTFDGWYADATFSVKFDFNSAVTKDTIVYAKWTKNSAEPTDPVSPQTGDNSHMTLWAMLMGAAFVGLVSCGILGKKRKNER